MKLITIAFLAAAIAAALILASCGRSSRRYFIYMVNRTPRDIEGVAVYFNDTMAAEKGHLVKGGRASFGYVTLPIPTEAEVRWDDQGQHHAPKVKLRGVIPEPPVEIDIYFIIEEDASVTVKWVRSNDVAGGVEATKGIEKFRVK